MPSGLSVGVSQQHAFYFFLTNSVVVVVFGRLTNFFQEKKQKRCVITETRWCVCVGGEGDYHVGHDTIFFLRTQSFGVPTVRSERGCKSSARRTTTTRRRRSFFCIKSVSFSSSSSSSSSREKERKSRPTAFEVGILRRSK